MTFSRRNMLAASFAAAPLLAGSTAAAADAASSGTSPFLGEIRLFGFDFAPPGWMPCDGRLLAISEHTALFALLGTLNGGDGMENFAIPTLNSEERAGLHYCIATVGLFPSRS